MIFREGTNKKGLVFFLVVLFAILVYLAWQTGDVITEEESLVIAPVKNYHVKLSFNNATYDLWRYDNLLKFQQDEQIQFYYDVNSDSLRVYNRNRLVTSSSNFSDFILRYDPYQVVKELKSSLSYEASESINRYEVELYGSKASVYLNDHDLPDSIIFANSNTKIQYMYLNIADINLKDVLPQEVIDED